MSEKMTILFVCLFVVGFFFWGGGGAWSKKKVSVIWTKLKQRYSKTVCMVYFTHLTTTSNFIKKQQHSNNTFHFTFQWLLTHYRTSSKKFTVCYLCLKKNASGTVFDRTRQLSYWNHYVVKHFCMKIKNK